MELNKLQEKELLSLDNRIYFIVDEGDYFCLESSIEYPKNYDVKEFTKLLSVEERKFLIAESVMDSIELYEYFHGIYCFSSREDFKNSIRALNEEELDAIISVLKYTKSFNGYLRYMISDWKADMMSDCFESEEEYRNYTY